MEVAILPRPSRYDDAIMDKVAERLLPTVMIVIGAKDVVRPQVLEDLKAVLCDSCWAEDLDGYRLARQLEQCCNWDPDIQLANALDTALGHAMKVHEIEVIKWVKEVSPRQYFKVGDRVLVLVNGQLREGEIERVEEHVAHYRVNLIKASPEERGLYVIRFEDTYDPATIDLSGRTAAPKGATTPGDDPGRVCQTRC